MRIRNLNQYTNRLIKDKRVLLTFICIAALGVPLFFRIAEAAVYSIVLYTGEIQPLGLFLGDNIYVLTITALCTLMRYTASAPIFAAAASAFMNVCSENSDCPTFGQALLSAKVWRRSISAIVISKLIGALLLAPAFVFGYGIIVFIERNSLFFAVHGAVLTLVSVVIWFRARLSMSAVPFILAVYPDMKLRHIFLRAFSVMRNRKLTLIRLFLLCGLTLRFTKLFASWALFINISIKEDEYLEEIDFQSGYFRADESPKLSHRAKRRFQKAAD